MQFQSISKCLVFQNEIRNSKDWLVFNHVVNRYFLTIHPAIFNRFNRIIIIPSQCIKSLIFSCFPFCLNIRFFVCFARLLIGPCKFIQALAFFVVSSTWDIFTWNSEQINSIKSPTSDPFWSLRKKLAQICLRYANCVTEMK